MKLMLLRRSVLTLATMAALSAGLADAQTTTTATTSRLQLFGPVGLGATETAEINLVNVASNATSGTAASCTGTVSFVNAAGTTLGTATPFTVTSGQSFSARLPFTSAGLTAPRGIIRAVVSVTVPTVTPRPPCSLDISFELFDTTTGATHILLTGETSTSGR